MSVTSRLLLFALLAVAVPAAAQNALYVGDLRSVDRAFLESPEPSASARPRDAAPTAPADQKKRSSFFGRLTPSWLRGGDAEDRSAPPTPEPSADAPSAVEPVAYNRESKLSHRPGVKPRPTTPSPRRTGGVVATRPSSGTRPGLLGQFGGSGRPTASPTAQTTRTRPAVRTPQPARPMPRAIASAPSTPPPAPRQLPRPLGLGTAPTPPTHTPAGFAAHPIRRRPQIIANPAVAALAKAPPLGESPLVTTVPALPEPPEGDAVFITDAGPDAIADNGDDSEPTPDADFAPEVAQPARSALLAADANTDPSDEPQRLPEPDADSAEPIDALAATPDEIAVDDDELSDDTPGASEVVALPAVDAPVDEPAAIAADDTVDLLQPEIEADPLPEAFAAMPTVGVEIATDVPGEAVALMPLAPAAPARVAAPIRPAVVHREPSDRAKALLTEAHAIAASADSIDEYAAIVQRCRYVLAIEESPQAIAYANQLASWSLNNRGEALVAMSRAEEAEADFVDALRADEDCWRAEHNLGVLDAQRGDFDSAKRRFNRTLELNPEYAKAYSNRAALWTQAGDYEAAMRDFQLAIQSDPDLAPAHTGRGRVCHMLGRLDEALRHYDAAALLAPDEAGIAVARGDLLVDLGRYSYARSAYERAIELDPEDPRAYRNLAWLQATCPVPAFRDGQAALSNAKRAERLAATDGTADDIAMDTEAAALAAVGRFDEAAALQRRAIEIAPEADAGAYLDRLALYERGEAFTSKPIGGVVQATYTE